MAFPIFHIDMNFMLMLSFTTFYHIVMHVPIKPSSCIEFKGWSKYFKPNYSILFDSHNHNWSQAKRLLLTYQSKANVLNKGGKHRGKTNTHDYFIYCILLNYSQILYQSAWERHTNSIYMMKYINLHYTYIFLYIRNALQ